MQRKPSQKSLSSASAIRLNEQVNKVRSKIRKAVTGDEKKRIRDLIKEKENEASYVKFFDKVGFTLGVLNITVCQLFLLNFPRYYWLWYSVVIPFILSVRIYHFKTQGWEYFMFDFCYFAIFLTFLDLYIFESPLLSFLSDTATSYASASIETKATLQELIKYVSATVFKIIFIFTNGPLPVAVPLWRNSIVFHDYDKMTSVYIHILPGMLYYCARWYGHECLHRFSTISLSHISSSHDTAIHICLSHNEKFTVPSLTVYDYVYAAVIYLFWQWCYFMKTEVIDKEKLDKRPDLLTSLRWMSTDTKNPIARMVLRGLKSIGVFRRDEDYDAKSTKTKLVFMGSQFVYTTVAFIVTPFLYYSHSMHLAYLTGVFVIALYNGASFYIDVFSSRYQRQLESLRKYVDEDDSE